MSEDRDTRLRRLAMRSMRRGIREMDLILQDFSSRELPGLGTEDLDLYEALLEESDHDLYRWISGGAAAPAPYAALVGRIATGAEGLTRPDGRVGI